MKISKADMPNPPIGDVRQFPDGSIWFWYDIFAGEYIEEVDPWISECQSILRDIGWRLSRYTLSPAGIEGELQPIGEQVKGFSRYIITKDGRVYDRSSKRFLRAAPARRNLGVNLVGDNGIISHKQIPRLVLEAFVGPSRSHIVHFDGDKSNNNLSNLEYKANQIHRDRVESCRRLQKKTHGNARLTKADVIDIRHRLPGETDLQALADEFGVSRSAIAGIKYWRTWKHLA